VLFWIEKLLMRTLPVLAPVPVPIEVELLAPQLNDIRSCPVAWTVGGKPRQT
jgi:hypothetical protein